MYPKLFKLFLRILSIICKTIFLLVVMVLVAYNYYLYHFQVRLNEATFLSFLDYVVISKNYYIISTWIYLKDFVWEKIKLFVSVHVNFLNYIGSSVEQFGNLIGIDLKWLAMYFYNHEINIYLILQYYCILFVILYILALSIWTRAAGPRIRLDQLISLAFKNAVVTLILLVILLILSLSIG